MATLPRDIIPEILCRLVVKDLVRFRCVSKPWCTLIDDPDFIKLHLSHSLQTNSNLSLVLGDINRSLLPFNFDSLKKGQKLKYPVEESHEGKYINLLGSCNGLLALCIGDDKALSLWNPWTRKSQMLPATRTEFPPWEFRRTYISHGFGYDPISDDYKLVRVINFYDYDAVSMAEVEVYSLRTNSWRRIKDFPFHLSHNGVFVNNTLHWEVSTPFKWNNQRLVGALDLGTEEYRLFEFPDCLAKWHKVELHVLGGCLCLVASYWFLGYDDIWIMKEYGVKESWTKLTSITDAKQYLSYLGEILYFPLVKPVAFSKDGHRVLLNIDCGAFVWIDLRSSGVKKVGSAPHRCIFVSEMMVESLVPLNGNGAMFHNKNNHGGKKRKRSTNR